MNTIIEASFPGVQVANLSCAYSADFKNWNSCRAVFVTVGLIW